jgi:pimeloyl-ACP methyl ester carboxylesterase
MSEESVHHLELPGGAIAWMWSDTPGDSPLVMLHGLGDSAIRTFPPHITTGPLAGYPLLFVDLPGFGESRFTTDHPATISRYADDVATLLQYLGTSPTAVFGHSMGGNVALHLAHRYPHLVSRLVLAEPLLDASQSILAAGIAKVSEETFVNRRFAMLLRATSMQAHRGDRASTAFLDPLRRTNPVAMHRAARSLINEAAACAESLLLGLPMPRTVLVGERTVADTLGLECAGIPVVRIPGAGHFMLAEAELNTTCAILKAIT